MDVTIIGTGNMARGIGMRLVSGGHAVTLLGTEPAKAQQLASDLGGRVAGGTALHIAVQEGLGTGYGSVVKILG